jgi:hypothetical protein
MAGLGYRQGMRWAWTHKYAVPMFVSSLVAVVLSGSGLVAVMVFANGGDRPGDNGGPETSGTETSGTETGIDPCVLGTWEVVEYTENTAGVTAELTRGTPVFTFEEDGTGVADFAPDTTIEADILGSKVEAGVAGQITYQYETAGETFEFVAQDSTAKFSSDLDIVGYGGEFTVPTGPLDYSCDGDAMTITGEEQAFEYRRSG